MCGIIDEVSMVDLPFDECTESRDKAGDPSDPGRRPESAAKCDLAVCWKRYHCLRCFPVVMLTKIFRQAGESDIVVNAHKINRGEPVILDNKSRDFFFLKRQEPNVIISVMLTLIQKKLPKYVNAGIYDIHGDDAYAGRLLG